MTLLMRICTPANPARMAESCERFHSRIAAMNSVATSIPSTTKGTPQSSNVPTLTPRSLCWNPDS